MKFIKINTTNSMFIIGLLIILIIAINSINKENELKEKGILTFGKITNISLLHKAEKEFNYEFKDKSGTIHIRGECLPLGNSSFFVGRSFPVIYNPEDPESNHILITRKYFKIYGVNFPDSLIWIDTYSF